MYVLYFWEITFDDPLLKMERRLTGGHVWRNCNTCLLIRKENYENVSQDDRGVILLRLGPYPLGCGLMSKWDVGVLLDGQNVDFSMDTLHRGWALHTHGQVQYIDSWVSSRDP